MQELAFSATDFDPKSNRFNEMDMATRCEARVPGFAFYGSFKLVELNLALTLSPLKTMTKIPLSDPLLRFRLLAAIPAAASVVIVGLPPDPGNRNQFPFGGAYNGEYQQAYTRSLFSGPITITNLEFYNTQFDSWSTLLGSATTTISLSTTSADWNTISPTFAANIGTNNTTVFSGNLGQACAFLDTLHIKLTTPFTYNPPWAAC